MSKSQAPKVGIASAFPPTKLQCCKCYRYAMQEGDPKLVMLGDARSLRGWVKARGMVFTDMKKLELVCLDEVTCNRAAVVHALRGKD